MNERRGGIRGSDLIKIDQRRIALNLWGWNEFQFDGFSSLDQSIVDGINSDLSAVGAGGDHNVVVEQIVIDAVVGSAYVVVKSQNRRFRAACEADHV